MNRKRYSFILRWLLAILALCAWSIVWAEASLPQNVSLELTPEEQTWLADHPKIVLGISDQFQPDVIIDPNGSPSGLIVDYFKRINEQLGNRLQLQVEHDWQSITKKAIQRDIDGLASSTPNPTWDQYFIYSQPYYYGYFYFYVLADAPAISGLMEAQGKRVGYLTGMKKVEYLLQKVPNAKLLPFDSNEAMVKALLERQVDTLIAPSDLEWWRRRNSIWNFKISGFIVESHHPLVMSIRNDWKIFVSIVNKALNHIPAAEQETIRQRWLGGNVPTINRKIDLTQQEQAWIAAHPVIRLGTDGNFVPYVKRQPDGNTVGIEPDILARINALTGTNIQLELGKWADIVARAERGELEGLATSAAHPERAAKFLFSNSSYSIVRFMYTRKDKAAQLRLMDDLSGKKVGLLRGSLVEQKTLARWPTIVPVLRESYTDLGVALMKGEVDAVISGMSMRQTLNEQLFSGIDIGFTVPNSEVAILYSIRKEYPELLSIINKALAAIGPEEIRTILEKWGVVYNLHTTGLVLTEEERAWIHQHPVVRTRIFNFPPYNFWDNGPRGIAIDLAEKILNPLGIHIEYTRNISWTDTLEDIRQHEVDLLLNAKNSPKRETFLAFSQDYLSLPWVIFTRQNDHSVFSLEDLYGKTVAIERGYFLQEKLAKEYPQIPQLLTADAVESLAAVSKGKATAYIGNLIVAQFHIVNQGFTNLKVVASTDLGNFTQAFAVRKDWPQLASILDKGLATITPEERNAIQRKYFSVELTERVDYTRLLQVAIGALFIIAVILYWNRRLAWEITGRKQAEAQYREMSVRLQKIADRVPGMVYQFQLRPDGSSCFPYVSNTIREICRLSPEEVATDASKVFTLIHPEDYDKVMASIQKSARTLSPWQLEHRIRHPDGTVRWLFGNSIPESLSDRGILWHGFIMDITERKLADEALHDSEAKLRALSDNLPDGLIYQIDSGTNGSTRQFTYISSGVERLHGVTAAEVLDNAALIYTQVVAEDQAVILEREAVAIANMLPFNAEVRCRLPSGEIRWRMFASAPRRQPNGHVVWDGVEIDINDRKQTEVELIRAREAAEVANQAKSAFLANMSHELRTPLNAVLGFAQILAQDITLTDHQRGQIYSIQRGGEYLLTLINDVLDLAKIEAGRFEIMLGLCNTTSFFREIEYMFKMRSKQKEITFHYESKALPRTVQCDDKRLRQILINLLSNAIKFTSQGGVILRSEFINGKLCLEISDTGVGIAADEIEKIFEPFQQAGESRYKIQGTGLGLAITRRLVDAMGGQLVVESILGKGSLFRVSIPVEVVSTMEEAQSSLDKSEIIGYSRMQGTGSFRILVTDDIPDNRQVLMGLLEPLGFKLAEANNGLNCLAVAMDWQPDVILMDLRMPELDGLEATRRLRKLPTLHAIPIIAISASTFFDDREASLTAGCNEHLGKPVQLLELLNTLGKLLPLQWHYAIAMTVENKAPQENLSPEQTTHFQHLVKSGDITGLQKFANQLEQLGNCPVFTKTLFTLLRSFDLKGLRRLAEELQKV